MLLEDEKGGGWVASTISRRKGDGWVGSTIRRRNWGVGSAFIS